MNSYSDRTSRKKAESSAASRVQGPGNGRQIASGSPEAIAQRELHQAIKASPRVMQMRLLQSAADRSRAHIDAPIVQRVLSPEEYESVKTLANRIIAQYPPDKFHYLGLGKSPTPVMAYLQTYGTTAPIDASNMPLSKFGHRHSSMTGPEQRVVDGKPLDEEQRDRLWEHFDNFVPGPGELEGKNILLIDLVQTGKSLVATQRHLQEYLAARYHGTGGTGLFFKALSALSCFPSAPSVSALPLAIEEQQVGGTKKTMDDLDLSSKAIMIPGTLGEESSLAARMGGEKYKPMAEYPDDFKISADNKPKTSDIRKDPNREYRALLQQFSRFQAEDESLVRLVEGSHAIDIVEESVSETAKLL